MFGLHRRVRIAYRPALKCTHFTTFSCFFQGQRKVASREALWGGLLRIFKGFLGFWGILGEPIWHHFRLKMASGAELKKRSKKVGTAVDRPTPRLG